MFQKIITVSLNPAIDTTLWLASNTNEEWVKPQRELSFPAGKAVNVSRVLLSLGQKSHIICLVGNDNAAYYRSLLETEKLSYSDIVTKGRVRENILLCCPDKPPLQINRSGIEVMEAELEHLKNRIFEEADNEVLFVFSGSLPNGVSKKQYIDIMKSVKAKGAKICVDSAVMTASDLKELHPFLIKPNIPEAEFIFEKSLSDKEDIHECLRILADISEHTLLSAGENGLYYANKEQMLHAKTPSVEVKNTVGAGDTTLAGFIYSLQAEAELDSALRFAAACGTASVRLDGTAVIKRFDIGDIMARIVVENVETLK